MDQGPILLAVALLAWGAPFAAAEEALKQAASSSTAVSISTAPPQRAGAVAEPAASSSTAVSISTGEFIPLLAPVAAPHAVRSRAQTISNGRLKLSGVYQKDNAGSHYAISRVESDGAVERLYGGPWSITWLGNVSYRDSSRFSASSDFHRPRLHLMSFALSRKTDGGGFVRLGRVLPTQLPGIGYIDGGQIEAHPLDCLRLGAAAGLRPDLIDLGASSRQSLASGYATLEKGTRGHWYYSGTLGLLQTFFRGRADELALVYDQRSDLGPKLSLDGTTQVDYKAWSGPEPPGARLTRANVSAFSPLASFLTLRTGLDHYERAQTRAERDASGPNAAPLPDNRYLLYWIGAEEPLGGTLRLEEEVSRLETTGLANQTLWRLGLNWTGLLGPPDSLWSVKGYNLNQSEGDGYGLLLSALLPFADGRGTANLSAGLRDSARPEEKKTVTLNDLAARLTWRFNRRWSAELGVRQVTERSYGSTVADGALSYYW